MVIHGPNPDDAPSFDEVEAAGLDGTLRRTESARWRSPGRSDSKCDGRITLIRTEVREYLVEVDDDGNIVNLNVTRFDRDTTNEGGDILDIDDAGLWCSKCQRLGSDEYEAHGISEEWQEV